MTKIELLDDYINRCSVAIDCEDVDTAMDLQEEIVATFENEIKDITGHLDNYSCGDSDVCWLGDLNLLKSKLTRLSNSAPHG